MGFCIGLTKFWQNFMLPTLGVGQNPSPTRVYEFWHPAALTKSDSA